MRWNNLTIEGEEQHRLPGYRDPAAVRRFDAPEAMDMRFYEVHAKSVLNRVPERSPMPFRWTINPYRGCSHACTYCMGGETRILMADGRTKPLTSLAIGDRIYGTRRRGAHLRFVITEVLDKWSSIKPAYAVELTDGTELVASADHRFLTSRGWKHVLGGEQGAGRRPHLTLNSRLLGPGGFVDPPVVDDDYRRGYLCGMVRGDGHIGSYDYGGRRRASDTVHRFRLALVDGEALARSREYLADLAVTTTGFRFAAAVGHRSAIHAIRTQSADGVTRISELVAWPLHPGRSWVKGFLAGIFDAEACDSNHTIRIANTDEEILYWVRACLDRLGFRHVTEPASGRASNVRLLGGLCDRMRFLLTTDPAITRKRDIEGDAVKTRARLDVADIRPLETSMRLFDITTGTGDFVADGVVSHNCFARPTHKYLDFDSGRDFEREIVVKVNAPEVLRAELARPSWKSEHVALGTNTDPYQWVEGRYRLMRGIWEALADAANPCSVLTKSPLLLRDLDLMLELVARTSFTACLSIPTLDEKAWRETEPHTPNPRARLEAVAELNRAGVPTGVLIAPLMPGINDAPHQVEPLLDAAEESGATSIGGVTLHLRGEVRHVFMDWLQTARPDLVDRYRELYRNGSNAPLDERRRLARLVRRGEGHHAFRSYGHEPGRETEPPVRGPQRELQTSLF